MKILSFAVLLFCFTTTVVYCKSTADKDTCHGNYGGECVKEGKPGYCDGRECLLAFKLTSQPFLIKIRYPQNNKYLQNVSIDGGKMFLRGNGLGLTWSEGNLMRRTQQKDTWEYRLDFGIPAFDFTSEKKPPTRFEFRVFLNDAIDMLGPNFVLPLPLSSESKNMSKIPEFWKYPWFFNKKLTVTHRKIYSPQLTVSRDIIIVLPPSFYENTYKRYETLFFVDGEFLHYILRLLEIFMVKRAMMREILVVGIPSGSDFEERVKLLAISNGSVVRCVNGNFNDHCNGCLKCESASCSFQDHVYDHRYCYKWVKTPANGQLFLDFIQDTLIPESISEYRAQAGPKNNGILGFSFGGLFACHAIWTRPQTFGSAACLSPSFWWPFPDRKNTTYPDDYEYEFTTSTLMKYRSPRPEQKIYIDVGGNEYFMMIDPAREAARIIASTPFFELNKNVWFYIWQEEWHVFGSAVKRSWVPFVAFYGTEGSLQAEIVKLVETNSVERDTIAFITVLLLCLLIVSIIQ